MKRFALIACSSRKKTHAAPAHDLYDSDLFNLSLQFAERLEPDEIYVLSAKYGLLPIERVIEPYNKTLNEMSASDVKRWATYVLGQMAMVSDLKRDHFIILAGQTYRKFLVPYLGSYTVPLEGKRIGEQIQFLQSMAGATPSPTPAASTSATFEPHRVKGVVEGDDGAVGAAEDAV